MTKYLLVLVFLMAICGAFLTARHVGGVFEEKSLNSYLLKSGDSDPDSKAAIAHTKDARAYGYRVASQLALCSGVAGMIVGLWLRQRRR